MENVRTIKSALISVFHKEGLNEVVEYLHNNGVRLISTGGTQKYIEDLGYECETAESYTGYPSILGGRVKTLHPAIMGGILFRRDNEEDKQQTEHYRIPNIDLVIVDLYPFEQTVASGASDADIIEKIDIGGISLIRAAAKNFNDVAIVASKEQYSYLLNILKTQGAQTTLEQRRELATMAFGVSSHYDSAIYSWFGNTTPQGVRVSMNGAMPLRYGENPHQKAIFFGDFNKMFDKLHGKEISYNNLLDIDAAVRLIGDFTEPTFAILKHNNACGIATADNIDTAWENALACDPVSAFGGILISNRPIAKETAEKINKIFFEVIIAPQYSDDALEVLKTKKNRIILCSKDLTISNKLYRTALNGILQQDADTKVECNNDLRQACNRQATNREISDLLFANKIVKHSKSNSIVLAKDGKLLASGVGQTSRVDALRQAIDKAKSFGFDLTGSVMASDAFFPFSDCVQIAHEAGVVAVIHPGGSIRDQESIDYCNEHNMAMIITGFRHFKH
jgi:phosphoribosylaminoimidazolecarboxamide formyltransferase/IMP cyclohydrolase